MNRARSPSLSVERPPVLAARNALGARKLPFARVSAVSPISVANEFPVITVVRALALCNAAGAVRVAVIAVPLPDVCVPVRESTASEQTTFLSPFLKFRTSVRENE